MPNTAGPTAAVRHISHVIQAYELLADVIGSAGWAAAIRETELDRIRREIDDARDVLAEVVAYAGDFGFVPHPNAPLYYASQDAGIWYVVERKDPATGDEKLYAASGVVQAVTIADALDARAAELGRPLTFAEECAVEHSIQRPDALADVDPTDAPEEPRPPRFHTRHGVHGAWWIVDRTAMAETPARSAAIAKATADALNARELEIGRPLDLVEQYVVMQSVDTHALRPGAGPAIEKDPF